MSDFWEKLNRARENERIKGTLSLIDHCTDSLSVGTRVSSEFLSIGSLDTLMAYLFLVKTMERGSYGKE